MCRSTICKKVGVLFMVLPTVNIGDATIGVVTLGTLIFWPRLGIRLPGHLPALLAGCAVMGIVNLLGGDVATIDSQFHYILSDGNKVMASRSFYRSWCCRGIFLALLSR